MLSGWLVREDHRAFAIQPSIAAGEVDSPLGIDQVFDGSGAQAYEGLRNARTRGGNAGVDQELAVSTGEDSDIAARAFEHAQVAAQPVNFDRRLGRLGPDQVNERAGLGKDLARREPASRDGERRRTEAAQAKATT